MFLLGGRAIFWCILGNVTVTLPKIHQNMAQPPNKNMRNLEKYSEKWKIMISEHQKCHKAANYAILWASDNFYYAKKIPQKFLSQIFLDPLSNLVLESSSTDP